jgi:hypothetical protein
MLMTLLRRVVFVLGAASLVAVLALVGLIFAFRCNFHQVAPNASYGAPRSALEAQRQDLDYFAKGLALDRAFSASARAAAAARVSALKSLPEALPPPKLQVALMQVMALADNGHTRMGATAGQDTLILPLRVTLFADGFYVLRTAAPYRDMLGGRVDSIDGHAIDEVLPQLETLRGGVLAFRRQNAAQFMIVQDLLYGLGIASDPRLSTWTVTLPDGRVVTRQLQAEPLQSGHDLPEGDRWLYPDSATGTEPDWFAYRPQSGEVPETWRDFGDALRLFPATGSCAEVVRLRTIADTPGRKIAPFLTETEAALLARPPCAVIVDLRGDGGGDYTHTWHFAHALPQLVMPGGRIYLLTDSLTFSAAITTAAFIKDAGGDRVTIIGEPVGDRMSFFSEGGQACLPNRKVCLFYQTGKHDYAQACSDWHECFWLNWLYPVRVKGLQPDILVPLKFEDWNAGRDEAYFKALALAGQAPRL